MVTKDKGDCTGGECWRRRNPRIDQQFNGLKQTHELYYGSSNASAFSGPGLKEVLNLLREKTQEVGSTGTVVLLTNAAKCDLQAAGLDEVGLQGQGLHVILGIISAIGDDDRNRSDTGSFWGASGLCVAMTGKVGPEDRLQCMPLLMGEVITGCHLTVAVTVAILRHHRTGQVSLAEASLHRAGIWSCLIMAMWLIKDPVKVVTFLSCVSSPGFTTAICLSLVQFSTCRN